MASQRSQVNNSANYQQTMTNVMNSFADRRRQEEANQSNQNVNQGQGLHQNINLNLGSISSVINDPRSRAILDICSHSEVLCVTIQELKFERFDTPQLVLILNFVNEQMNRIQVRLWD